MKKMEEPFRSRVLNSIFTLSQITECSQSLLIFLLQERVLIQQDIGVINSIPIPIEKCHKLYEILLRCPGSYEPFIEGLRETNQLGVIEILENCTEPVDSSPRQNRSPSTSPYYDGTPPTQRKLSPSPHYYEGAGATSSNSPPQRPPYPVDTKFFPEMFQDSPAYMPLPQFEFTVPPPSPAVPEAGEMERCPSLHNLQAQLQQLNGTGSPTLDTLHKYLLRSHSSGKPLILTQTKFKPSELNKSSQKYAAEYHHHFDHNVVWIDAKNRKSLEETFHHAVKNYRVDMDYSSNVGFDLGKSHNNDCCSGEDAGGQLDIKKMSIQLYKHFLGKRCLFIFENVEKDDPCLADVLPPIPSPPGYPAILMISATECGQNDSWDWDNYVVELTEDDRIARKSINLGKVIGPIFNTVLDTYNKAKCEYKTDGSVGGFKLPKLSTKGP